MFHSSKIKGEFLSLNYLIIFRISRYSCTIHSTQKIKEFDFYLSLSLKKKKRVLVPRWFRDVMVGSSVVEEGFNEGRF